MSNATLQLGGGNFAVKDGKLLGYATDPKTSVFVSREFDFSRPSYATRVNEDGLIEKETQNLLLHSNQFDTTWTTLNAGVTSGQSGYDGSSDAWLLSITGGTSDQRIYQTIQYNGVSTLSVFAKKNNSNWLSLRIGSSVNKWYDLENGVLGGSTIVNAYIDASIEDYGNGWYRCSLTFTDNFNTTTRIYPADDDLVVTQTSGSIYIQDAQVEAGLVARNYIETTTTAFYGGITDNIARIDYTNSSSPALLLEPQRTNLVTQSEYFGGWLNKVGISLDFGYLAPDGTNSAYKITKTGVNAHLADNFGGMIVSGVHKSIWAKTTSGTGDVYLLSQTGQNLVTLTDEWQRFDVTHSGANFFYPVDFRGSEVTLTDVLVWGAQAEQGSYATSYIPTYGTAVTRNAEVCGSLTSAGDDGFIKNYTTSIMVDLAEVISNNNVIRFVTLFASGGASNPRVLLYASSSQVLAQYRVTGQSDISIGNSYTPTNQNKVLLRLNDTKIALFHNGSKIGEATIVKGNDIEYLTLAESSATDSGYRLNKLLSFPTALTDQEAIDLTTI